MVAVRPLPLMVGRPELLTAADSARPLLAMSEFPARYVVGAAGLAGPALLGYPLGAAALSSRRALSATSSWNCLRMQRWPPTIERDAAMRAAQSGITLSLYSS